jgi:NADH:ubiquinone reductase (H+-translocating)
MAKAEGVDIDNGTLITNKGRLGYDYFVVATGASLSYFGHDEWADHAPASNHHRRR